MTPQQAFPLPLNFAVIPPWEIVKGERQQFRLLSDFTFISEKWGAITAPAGFITDAVSSPTFGLFYVSPIDPDVLFGAIAHDFLYERRGVLDGSRCLTKKESDRVLKEAMTVLDVPWWKRHIVYRAVLNFGGRKWKD